MVAAGAGHEEIVAKLLAARANPNVQDADGNSALMLAVSGREDGSCYPRIVTRLLAAGADPNLKDVHGVTVLLTAAANGYEGIVRQLLAANADPNVRDNSGWTALVAAAEDFGLDDEPAPGARKRIVARLLAAGATPSLRFNGADVQTTPEIQAMVRNAAAAAERQRRRT